MLKRTLNNYGFASILEVTITAIVFSIAAVGLMSTITMVNPESTISSKRLEAAYVGKSIMDELRRDVDASTWFIGNADNPLSTGTTFTRTVDMGGIQYNVSYFLTDVDDARQMTMTIDYPD